MLQEHSILHAVNAGNIVDPSLRSRRLSRPCCLAGSAGGRRRIAKKKPPKRLSGCSFTVPIPPAPTNTTGGMYAFDISFVDQTNQTYYLGDRSNQAVDVVNAKTGTFVTADYGNTSICGGLSIRPEPPPIQPLRAKRRCDRGTGTCLFAGDGPSRVVSFTIPSGTQVSSVFTGGTMPRRTKWLSTPRTDCCWW